MKTDAVVVAGTGRRQRRSIAEKRRMVEETMLPNASVARVARAHGVNANQVFLWRRLYRQGRLGGDSSGALVRVRLADRDAAARREGTGALELEVAGGRLRIEAGADRELVRMLLGYLLP